VSDHFRLEALDVYMRGCAYDPRLPGTIGKSMARPFGQDKMVKVYSHSMPMPKPLQSSEQTEQVQNLEVLHRCLSHYKLVIELERLYNKLFGEIDRSNRLAFCADLKKSLEREMRDCDVQVSRLTLEGKSVYLQTIYMLSTPATQLHE